MEMITVDKARFNELLEIEAAKKENKITINQFLSFTNVYVPVYIEDVFMRYDGIFKESSVKLVLTDEQWNCPIDYIRNVDGGHFGDDKKKSNAIVLESELKITKSIFAKNKRFSWLLKNQEGESYEDFQHLCKNWR